MSRFCFRIPATPPDRTVIRGSHRISKREHLSRCAPGPGYISDRTSNRPTRTLKNGVAAASATRQRTTLKLHALSPYRCDVRGARSARSRARVDRHAPRRRARRRRTTGTTTRVGFWRGGDHTLSLTLIGHATDAPRCRSRAARVTHTVRSPLRLTFQHATLNYTTSHENPVRLRVSP